MSDARIYDRGYRRYEGQRLGQSAAIRSLWRHTVQRIMGLRRSARHKILPFLSVGIAYLPAIAFIGILALLPKDINNGQGPASFVPKYYEYYGFVSAAIVVFVVFSAPEALCPDRRYKTMSVYLASPLNRETYLLSKALAVASVILFVTFGPLLLLLIGYILQSNGPDGPVGVMAELARIAGAGLAVAVFYTAFALAVASLTDRRGLATGGSLIVIFITHVMAGILAFAFGLNKAVLVVSLLLAPFELGVRILGAPGRNLAAPDVSTWVIAAGCAAWTVVFAGLVYLRYSALQVTR
jgi:ABC-2 type transport system permease protein